MFVTLITSVATFLVLGGGAQDPQMYRQKEKKLLYMCERVKRASASETYILGLQIDLHVQSMQFPFITYGMALYRQYNDKILTLSMRVSGASELRFFFFAFSHSKTAISFYILLVLVTLCLRNIYIFRSQITPAGSFLLLLVVWLYIINASIPTKH